MKRRVFLLLILLSLMYVLIPLQRADAAVTISAVGTTKKATKATDTGNITFTARITSEAGDSYNQVTVTAAGIGKKIIKNIGGNIQEDLPIYTVGASPNSISIDGAGTQDVTITLNRSQIIRADTIKIAIYLGSSSTTISSLTTAFTVTVTSEIDISLIVKEGIIQHLPVDPNLLNQGGKISDVTFTLKIRNKGPLNLKVNLTLSKVNWISAPALSLFTDIDTTQISLSSTSVTLASKTSEEVTITVPGSLFVILSGETVHGPLNERIQHWQIQYGSYFFKAVATPEGASAETEEVALRINVVRPVDAVGLILEALDGSRQTTTMDDTDDITYTLRLTNTGLLPDRINFTISGDVGTAALDIREVVLYPDDYNDSTLTIPRTALSNAGTYYVTITATSENNPTVTAIAVTNTTVTGDTSTITGDTSTPTNPTEPIEPTDPDQSTYQVVLSEFMFEAGDGETGLPQWIEVYNNSSSEVNLRGWKLQWTRLQPTSLEATTTIDRDLLVPPQQARLIVTALGRHSGGGNLSEDAVYQLPPLLPDGLEEAISIKQLREILGGVLSLTLTDIFNGGFSLRLTNSNDVLVDHIGTLSGGKKRWELPESLIEGDRSSLIRRFDKGVPRSGIEKRAWRRAYDAKGLVTGLYYGSPRDLGTPGYRRGKPLPVELSQFSAKIVKDQVVINWTTESELDNAGFNIFRSTSRTKDFRRINAKLIQGAGTTGQRTQYQFIDKTAKPDVAYYYRLEDVDLSGTRDILTTYRLRGVITPTGKLITTWGTLKDDR